MHFSMLAGSHPRSRSLARTRSGAAAGAAPGLSRPRQALAAGLAEGRKGVLTSGLRIRHDRLERRVAPHGVELTALPERRLDEISLRDRLAQVVEPALVLPDVAEEPALLEHRLRIVIDLQ